MEPVGGFHEGQEEQRAVRVRMSRVCHKSRERWRLTRGVGVERCEGLTDVSSKRGPDFRVCANAFVDSLAEEDEGKETGDDCGDPENYAMLLRRATPR